VIPALVATVQHACPVTTPNAVITPARRPPASVLRIVTAVSGPGVVITQGGDTEERDGLTHASDYSGLTPEQHQSR
jgi:hypothetical protein